MPVGDHISHPEYRGRRCDSHRSRFLIGLHKKRFDLTSMGLLLFNESHVSYQPFPSPNRGVEELALVSIRVRLEDSHRNCRNAWTKNHREMNGLTLDCPTIRAN
uniref:AlNc14C30G2833 protein n=1 Tax=Albugo laibachii Nc14 TaxID=890382 RepID=F0W7M8_9STRA|nr:AlNc14C30G2833 [Albugo laibachii Nc14]|eukprot:CCA17129.1 AlNc14C30G2833 [Albugo laibachii Nc14]